MTYTDRSIFMCTYVFEVDLSTSKIKSKSIKVVKYVIAKGNGIEGIKKDEWALNRAISLGGLKGKKVSLKEIIIDKYLSESFV